MKENNIRKFGDFYYMSCLHFMDNLFIFNLRLNCRRKQKCPEGHHCICQPEQLTFWIAASVFSNAPWSYTGSPPLAKVL